ncbi:MAG: hypothetical protein LC667_02990, partial [Thioalkalivibrio sp.]|nr:hypothetical protein [Thioalkalivibrio sp.]
MLQTNRIKLLALVLLATACSSDGVGTEGPSWFRASVSGEVNREYQGRGVFASGPDDDVQTAPHFRIASDGEDVGTHQSFYLRWPDARRPAPGTYELVPHDDEYGSTRGVTAVYTWSQGDNVSSPASSELYVAAAGTVEI